jgi:hypothetical protein
MFRGAPEMKVNHHASFLNEVIRDWRRPTYSSPVNTFSK